jgi:uncharacterized protein
MQWTYFFVARLGKSLAATPFSFVLRSRVIVTDARQLGRVTRHRKTAIAGPAPPRRKISVTRALSCLVRVNVISSDMPWDIWLIFFVLAVVIPWRGRMRLKQMLAKPRVEPRERISLYLSTISFQWIAAGIAGWRAWAHGYTRIELGIGTGPNLSRSLVAGVCGTAILASLHWMNFRRMGRSLDKLPARVQAMATRILPQSPPERVPFLALAMTAGCCEEFLYRGFAMAAFVRAGIPIWASVVVSSVLFGAAHLYQGRGGLIGTGILGLIFGAFRAFTGTFLPVASWHAAIDIVAGIAGPRYLIQNKSVTSPGL